MSTAASSLPDFMGCTIDKHYKLTEVLGSGSFGVVYKAVDTRESTDSPARHRAVKIISKAGRAATELEAIRREVALHSVVAGHANIITIHDAIDDDEYFYIILDYCPGGDLFYHITEDVYVDHEERLRSAFVSLVDAVQHCHEHKIAHRDLKPENVLASKDGSKVFLADFGLATAKRMVDEHGSGTALYMAPECHGKLNGYQPYDARAADVWALGVILVNMMTGRNPWEKASMRDQSFVDYLTNPDFLHDTFPQLSKGVCEILADTLAFKPLKRISLPKLREAVMNLETFFGSEEEFSSTTDTTTTTTTVSTDESSLDVPDAPPALSSDEDEDEDDSPLVTPEGTTSGKPRDTEKETAGKVDWKKGSTAQLLMARHRLEEQFGNGFY